ncbi:hypothetical protein, partial [Pseudomonas aeruginosa]|uniref:hypothetical protein n=1 Tax=Pseudomonas aeruginosa TaxID=287 RepID=UPI0031B69DFE
QSHPVLEAFISLLSLPDSRFVSEDVLALLDVPVLAARFDITEEGLRYLRQWVNESGIRWGIDDDNVRELELPATGQHTWRDDRYAYRHTENRSRRTMLSLSQSLGQ